MDFALALQAALILAREGAEALLIVAAVAAFLAKAGDRARLRGVFAGAGAAVLASVVTAWVFARYFEGNHNDALEGVVMLIAAGLLFYVSGWLFLRQDPRAWQGYLREQASVAADRGGLALAAIGFLAVYREGAETILFLHALATSSGGWSFSIFAGLGAGAGVLVAAYVLIRTAAVKIPLRPLFIATSAFLFFMGLDFVGGGLKEFQELAWIPVSDAPGAAAIAALGLNPTLEVLGAQIAVCLAAALSFAALKRRRVQEA